MPVDKEFYKTKKLKEMTKEEWEQLCDGCGKCCYNKYIIGRGKKAKLYYTRISCDLLDTKTGLCKDYKNRFKKNKDCLQLSLRNLKNFKWLSKTCAYRLIYEGKELPNWHPLISGIPVADNPEAQKHLIKNGIHQCDAENWEDYIIDKEI